MISLPRHTSHQGPDTVPQALEATWEEWEWWVAVGEKERSVDFTGTVPLPLEMLSESKY